MNLDVWKIKLEYECITTHRRILLLMDQGMVAILHLPRHLPRARKKERDVDAWSFATTCLDLGAFKWKEYLLLRLLSAACYYDSPCVLPELLLLNATRSVSMKPGHVTVHRKNSKVMPSFWFCIWRTRMQPCRGIDRDLCISPSASSY